MNPWIKLYRTSLHNPKLVLLSDRQHRVWFSCLVMADDSGKLPGIREIACHIRMTIPDAEQSICDLIEAGLVDIETPGAAARSLRMHDWTAYQSITAVSTDRVRKFRNKNNTATNETVSETFQKRDETLLDQESDEDKDKENKLQLPKQAAARGRKSELDFNLSFNSGFGSRKCSETLLRQAEGFGLDVEEIIELTNRNAKPSKREGYFVTVCVNRLKGQLPGLDEQIIKAALNGKHEQVKTVSALLVGATP